jgi:hypothetical protein
MAARFAGEDSDGTRRVEIGRDSGIKIGVAASAN